MDDRRHHEGRDLLTVGLTGGIAGGKSTVASRLTELGAFCVDADTVAHELTSPGTEVYTRIKERFGTEIIAADGSIDRRRLAAIVFGDREQMGFLNEVVHPAVIEAIAGTLSEWRLDKSNRIGVVQAPLLIEAGMTGMFDVIVVVVSSPERQLSRLLETGMTKEDALARLRAQISDSDRLVYADITIINKGDLKLLSDQATALYERLLALAATDSVYAGKPSPPTEE